MTICQVALLVTLVCALPRIRRLKKMRNSTEIIHTHRYEFPVLYWALMGLVAFLIIICVIYLLSKIIQMCRRQRTQPRLASGSECSVASYVGDGLELSNMRSMAAVRDRASMMALHYWANTGGHETNGAATNTC